MLADVHTNTTHQSLTHILFYIQWYICQGNMFQPSRSSSGPPRRQIQELFSFTALWDPIPYKFLLQEHIVHKLVYIELGGPEDDLLCQNMCCPDRCTIVYKIKCVLMTDALYLYVITLWDGKPKKKKKKSAYANGICIF